MLAITYQASDFQRALLGYLPSGRVWPKDPNSVQGQVALGLGGVCGRISAAAVQTLVDALPSTTVNLLPEWQQTLGLPDSCQPAPATLSAAQAQCAARFAGNGGPSQVAMTALALTLGYSITITQFAPMRCGRSRVGSRMYGRAWWFVWRANWQAAEGSTVINANVLSCELNQVAPAHTQLIFQRTAPSGRLDFSDPRQSEFAGN